MPVAHSPPSQQQRIASSADAFSSVALLLYRLRYIAVMLLAATIVLVHWGMHLQLPMQEMIFVTLGLLLFNLLLGWRLRWQRAVSALEVFGQILADVFALTLLLYYCGGSANPFVSLYLLPLLVTAVILPARYAITMAIITLGCYSALMFYHHPLPTHIFNLHVLGMWLNFVLSAGLILGFVVRMAYGLRQRDAALAAAREQALRDEHIVSLGTVAAGAAHELATPLATMAVLAKETEQAHSQVPELAADMRCLREQIEACKQTLSKLRNYGNQQDHPGSLPADKLLAGIVDDWRRLRPAIPVSLHWQGAAPALRMDTTLMQSLTSLINNAGDASPTGIRVEGCVDADAVSIEILDSGAGIAPGIMPLAGKQPVTTKKNGYGVGLLLANASIERLGGQVSVFNRQGGGACTRISVPIASLETKA